MLSAGFEARATSEATAVSPKKLTQSFERRSNRPQLLTSFIEDNNDV
jgi:hypothetical protein